MLTDLNDKCRQVSIVPMMGLELATPRHSSPIIGILAVDFSVGVLHHYIFIIAQLWLTSHQRSTVVLLNTGTPGTSKEIFSEDADGETRTRNSSANPFPAIAFELHSSVARALGL